MNDLFEWLKNSRPRIPGHPKGGGSFGRWITDDSGLPAYEYDIDEHADSRAEYRTTKGISRDHWHLPGNDRVIATAHNGGYVQLYDWGRGGKVLNRWELSPSRPISDPLNDGPVAANPKTNYLQIE